MDKDIPTGQGGLILPDGGVQGTRYQLPTPDGVLTFNVPKPNSQSISQLQADLQITLLLNVLAELVHARRERLADLTAKLQRGTAAPSQPMPGQPHVGPIADARARSANRKEKRQAARGTPARP